MTKEEVLNVIESALSEPNFDRSFLIKGNLRNGSFVTKESIVRPIRKVDDNYLYCVCGRVFFIDNDLIVKPFGL